jgi:sulfide:quinone oxidoreductase
MAMFGPQATVALREDLVAGGVDVRAGVFVSQVDRRLVVQPGDRPLDAQRVVALPRAAARPPRGLPVDENGFIPVDLHGRVAGLDGVWAAGDATSFPIKQGGIASQLADAAAESIAAAAGAPVEPTPFKPVLRGVVLTGRGKRWIRRDLEGGDAGAVAADAGDEERHALWWPPTKVAGRYLSPFLGALAAEPDADAPPSGQPVELDLERDVASAADALRIARMRDETTGGREIPPTD